MNLPNRLTVARILLAPVFLILLMVDFPCHYLAAGLVFGAAALTDLFDGKIARGRGLVTNLGKFLDPIADKMLTTAAFLGFLAVGKLDVFAVMLILSREFMVTSVRLMAAKGDVVMAASIWGKAKTVSQIVAICVILLLQYIGELGGLGLVGFVTEEMAVLFWGIGEVFLAIATFFAVLSGLIYLKQNWDIVKNAK